MARGLPRRGGGPCRALALACLLLCAAAAVTADCPARGTPMIQVVPTESPVFNLEWAGTDSPPSVIFAHTQRGRVHRSADSGKSWTDVTPQFTINGNPPPDYISPVAIEIQVHPANPNEVFVRGTTSHWSSRDAGATFTEVQTPAFATGDVRFKMHPTEPGWLLVALIRDSCFAGNNDPTCGYDLFVSQNFGASWRNLTATSNGQLAGFVSNNYDWAWGNVRSPPGAQIKKETIFATAYALASDRNARRSGWDRHINFYRSDDFFASNRLVTACGNAFTIVDNRIFLAAVKSCLVPGAEDSSVLLLTSDDGAQSFVPGCFPVDLPQQGYTMVDALEGSALICVDADTKDVVDKSAPVTNLYASDNNFAMYSLSMRHAVSAASNIDLMRIHGIDGIYMANHLSSRSLRDPDVLAKRRPYSDYYMTKVTFSKGGRWENLTLPALDANGSPIVCKDDFCLLHLHGPTSWAGTGKRPSFASFYSHSSAPGVIMATGNIGKFLSFDPRMVNTYLSRDGGESWDEIRKGPYIYEYGDHGAILVMTKHTSQGETDELYFSLDLGVCWEGPIKFSQKMGVDNIRIEPLGFSRMFIVHGSTVTDEYSSRKGAMAVVDFRVMPLIPPIEQCNPLADYEVWSPDHCLLGARVKMQRRKRSSRCFNSLHFNRSMSSTPCTCTLPADLECEFGSERPGPGIPCAPIPGFDPSSCPAVGLAGRDLSPTHYRLVSQDVCNDVDGIVFHPSSRGGGGGGSRRGRGGVSGAGVAAIVISVLVVVLGLGVFVFTRMGGQLPGGLAVLGDVAVGIGAALSGAADWVRTQLGGSPAGYQRHSESEFALEEADKYSPPEIPS